MIDRTADMVMALLVLSSSFNMGQIPMDERTVVRNAQGQIVPILSSPCATAEGKTPSAACSARRIATKTFTAENKGDQK